MTLFHRIKWVMSILLVFVLIVATNLIDRDNFRRIKDSIVTIYEDRILAKDLIIEYLGLVHEKEMAVMSGDTDFYKERCGVVNQEFEHLTSRYRETKFTRKETVVFDKFQDDWEEMSKMEASSNVDNDSYKKLLFDCEDKLHQLAKIQVEESKNQLAIGKKAFSEIELFTQIEIYFLIFLAILVQIFILYRPKNTFS
jgi:hypothetical protein